MSEENENEWYDFTAVSPFEEFILEIEKVFRSLLSGKRIETISIKMVNIFCMIGLKLFGSEYELVYKSENEVICYSEENKCYDASIIEILNNKYDFVCNDIITNLFGVSEYFLFHRLGSSNYIRSISNEMLKTIESGISIAVKNTQLDIPIFISVYIYIFIYLKIDR